MGLNLTQKLLKSHVVSGNLKPGTDLKISVDQILIEDATGTMTAMQFELMDVDEIAVPLAVMYVDHNVLMIDDKNMQDHKYLQSFSQRYGLHYSPPGNGISHYIHLEHYAKPGEVLLGADSHTSMAGAVGMLAMGAGGLEVAAAMAGHGYGLVCPEVVGVKLTGKLSPNVEAKDIILELLRRHGVRGGRGRIFEFYGDGLANLSITARGTIANMIIETGGSTAVFPSDQETLAWLEAQGRVEDFSELAADDDATYDYQEVIELSELRPLIAIPHSPGNVELVADVSDTKLAQVCVGSSVNSSYEDLAIVAAVLRGKTIHPDVQLTVTPGSKQVLQSIISSGVYEDLVNAGARMLEPVCGPCVGIGQAPLAGKPSLRTFNRNFPGRSGTAEDNVFLCSPSTAAISALTGYITDPSSLETEELRTEPPVDAETPLRLIQEPLPQGQRQEISIIKGDNLVSPPTPEPLPTSLESKVGIVVGDDVSTGDMAPDGVIALAVYSNLEVCAKFMFRRFDAEFYERVTAWGGGIVVGGENYGQGSSREHAALVPMYLGIRVVAARSFARIHRRNLIAVGIVPLLIPSTVEDSSFDVGQSWYIDNLVETIQNGETSIEVQVGSGADTRKMTLQVELTPSEREMLVAGGLLAQIRHGKNEQLALVEAVSNRQ